jgi:hypothetical protein
MHNTHDHAGESKGDRHWWLSVEHNAKGHEVIFSFIDFGVGIFRSLENKGPDEPLAGALDYIKKLFPMAQTQVEKLSLILEGKVRLTQTNEYYRGKGLAAVLSDRMCEHILEVGKKPVWAHSSSNLGSMKTALKCGFVQDKINTVIRKNDSGG